jgi:hypothetical protein
MADAAVVELPDPDVITGMTFSGFAIVMSSVALTSGLERAVATFRSLVGGMSIELDSSVEDEDRITIASSEGQWEVTVLPFAMVLPPGEVKVSVQTYAEDGSKFTFVQSAVNVKPDPTAV